MSSRLILEATEDTPAVVFDREANIFKLSGRSYPENVLTFFEPIMNWLKIYTEQPNLQTNLEVDLEYINSGSVKMVFNMLYLIEAIAEKGNEARITWCYRAGDELMQQKGEEFQKFLDVHVELVERK